MLKSLIKKELLQSNQTYFFDRKKKTLKTKKQIILTLVLFFFIFLCCAFAFFGMGMAFSVFINTPMEWIFFSLSGLVATVVGVVIDIVATYNMLYKAKDNDLLLSMPISPAKLLFARILNTFIMGFAYESIAFLPFMVVYWIYKPITFTVVLFPVICWITIAVFVTVLSCLLGWVVAAVSSRLKNKNITKVLTTLLILAAYYIFYFKAINSLSNLLQYQDQIADAISGWLFLSYHMGLGASGKVASLGIYVGIVVALFAVTYFFMTKSYIKLVTTNKGSKKPVYKQEKSKQNSILKALFLKEGKRFTSCSTYMLNSGLGLVVMLVAVVVLIIKGSALQGLLEAIPAIEVELPWIGGAVTAACAIIPMMLISMNAISAPSVSLEGKSVWILQSCPIDMTKALKAKILFHIALCCVPTLLLSMTLAIVLGQGFVNSVLIVLFDFAYLVLIAVLGVVLDLNKANLSWTNEVYPIKQGFSVSFIILGGWGFSIILAALYYLTRNIVSATVFLTVLTVLVCVGSVLLYSRLMKNGNRKFMQLS